MCVMYFSCPKKHTTLITRGLLVHHFIKKAYWLTLCLSVPETKPRALCLPGRHSATDLHFQPFIFWGKVSLCSSGYLKLMTLSRWGFSHTPLCPADTSSQHCSKKAFRAKAAGAGCVFQLLTAGSALVPAMIPCSSMASVSSVQTVSRAGHGSEGPGRCCIAVLSAHGL